MGRIRSSREDKSPTPQPVFSGRYDRPKVTGWVYQEMKQAILDLRLAPGASLREAAISEQLGVSKTPVREAISRLEQEGLAEVASYKGAVVTGYSRTDLVEIYELRELLEVAAVRQAAQTISPAALKRLENLVEASRRERERGNTSKLAELITEFDIVLFDQVTNRRIRALVENLQAHLTRIGKLTEAIPGRVEASVEQHAEIVEGIRSGSPARAERSMRAHIQSVMADQLKGLSEASAKASPSSSTISDV